MEIKITITEEGFKCDTELSPYELVFWLEAVKNLVITDFMNSEEPADPPVE